MAGYVTIQRQLAAKACKRQPTFLTASILKLRRVEMTWPVLSNILYCLTSETPTSDTCHIAYESLPNSDLRLLNSVLPAHFLFPSASQGSCMLLGQTWTQWATTPSSYSLLEGPSEDLFSIFFHHGKSMLFSFPTV
jgi:hypothetical protein